MKDEQALSPVGSHAAAGKAEADATATQSSLLESLPSEIMHHHVLGHLFESNDITALRQLRQTCRSLRDAVDAKDLEVYSPRASTITQVVSGRTHNIVLINNDEIYVWGKNTCGELGLNDNVSRSSPHRLPRFAAPVKKIVAGHSHTIALLENGELYSWGKNIWGQLGHNDRLDRETPKKIEFDTPTSIIDVVAAGDHNLAISEDGQLFVWGFNQYRQLSFGDQLDRHKPTAIDFEFPAPIKQLYAANNRSLVVLENGQIFTWGMNHTGELGLGHMEPVYFPQVFDFEFPAPIKQIAMGSMHTIVLLKNNEIYGWGYNLCGELGLGDDFHRDLPEKLPFEFPEMIQQVFNGYHENFALLQNGDIYAWGSNDCGTLGLGTRENVNLPQRMNFKFPAPVKHISCRDSQTLALLENGLFFGWGDKIIPNDDFLFIFDSTPKYLNFDFIAKPVSAKTLHTFGKDTRTGVGTDKHGGDAGAGAGAAAADAPSHLRPR